MTTTRTLANTGGFSKLPPDVQALVLDYIQPKLNTVEPKLLDRLTAHTMQDIVAEEKTPLTDEKEILQIRGVVKANIQLSLQKYAIKCLEIVKKIPHESKTAEKLAALPKNITAWNELELSLTLVNVSAYFLSKIADIKDATIQSATEVFGFKHEDSFKILVSMLSLERNPELRCYITVHLSQHVKLRKLFIEQGVPVSPMISLFHELNLPLRFNTFNNYFKEIIKAQQPDLLDAFLQRSDVIATVSYFRHHRAFLRELKDAHRQNNMAYLKVLNLFSPPLDSFIDDDFDLELYFLDHLRLRDINADMIEICFSYNHKPRFISHLQEQYLGELYDCIPNFYQRVLQLIPSEVRNKFAISTNENHGHISICGLRYLFLYSEKPMDHSPHKKSVLELLTDSSITWPSEYKFLFTLLNSLLKKGAENLNQAENEFFDFIQFVQDNKIPSGIEMLEPIIKGIYYYFPSLHFRLAYSERLTQWIKQLCLNKNRKPGLLSNLFSLRDRSENYPPPKEHKETNTSDELNKLYAKYKVESFEGLITELPRIMHDDPKALICIIYNALGFKKRMELLAHFLTEQDVFGRTLLHYAVENPEICPSFIKMIVPMDGISVNQLMVQDAKEENPLQIAARTNNHPKFKVILNLYVFHWNCDEKAKLSGLDYLYSCGNEQFILKYLDKYVEDSYVGSWYFNRRYDLYFRPYFCNLAKHQKQLLCKIDFAISKQENVNAQLSAIRDAYALDKEFCSFDSDAVKNILLDYVNIDIICIALDGKKIKTQSKKTAEQRYDENELYKAKEICQEYKLTKGEERIYMRAHLLSLCDDPLAQIEAVNQFKRLLLCDAGNINCVMHALTHFTLHSDGSKPKSIELMFHLVLAIAEAKRTQEFRKNYQPYPAVSQPSAIVSMIDDFIYKLKVMNNFENNSPEKLAKLKQLIQALQADHPLRELLKNTGMCKTPEKRWFTFGR